MHVAIMGDFNHNLADNDQLDMVNNFWATVGLNNYHNDRYTHFDTARNTQSLIRARPVLS